MLISLFVVYPDRGKLLQARLAQQHGGKQTYSQNPFTQYSGCKSTLYLIEPQKHHLQKFTGVMIR
jgi:hypothetical protein